MAEAPAPRIQLRLTTRSGHVFKGRVVELSTGVVLADFPARGAPVLRIAEVGTLELSGGDLVDPVELAGRVVYRRDEEQSCRYRFMLSSGPSRLAGDADRRGSFRAAPPAGRVVPVAVGRGGLEVPVVCALEDVSTTGLSLGVTGAGEAKLHAVRDVHVEFTLPGVEQPFELAATVRYRALKDTVVKYGIEFVEGVELDAARPVLERWIAERQLDQLREIEAGLDAD